MDEIENWALDFDGHPVFWLNGLAGTGKSAIAQTIAERVSADGRLGASFFCSRNIEDRSDLQLVVPTLAFQLAQKYPAFRSSLIPLLQFDPDVVRASLQVQMRKLLVEPLQSADISTVIVIDALDECEDEEPESAILQALGELVSEIPRVKLFVTSRPGKYIVSGFRGPLLVGLTQVFVLHDVDPSTVNDDIRHFFNHELLKLAQRNDVDGWPTDEQVRWLCRRAGGFFLYAVATVNFLDHTFQDPSDQLDLIMKSPEKTTHESQAKLKGYTSLDSLYMSIFQEAFLENCADDDVVVRSVLGTVVLAVNPFSPSEIATLIGIRRIKVQRLLESIQSLMILSIDPNYPVRLFHKSFADFITDPARCIDTRFCISDRDHTELVLRSLELMGRSLGKDMCSIPEYAHNSEVEDLPERIGRSGIRGALEYACRSWHKHLIATKHRVVDVVSALRHFLEQKFLFWLEVLSVLGAVDQAIHALRETVKWLNAVRTDGQSVC